MDVTSDKWVLDVTKGYKIEFSSEPLQFKLPNLSFSQQEYDIIDNEVNKLAKKQVVELCDMDVNTCTYEYISGIFIRPKKDGSHRLILNLKSLNEHIEHLHFKMETLKFAITCVKKDVWFASVDLKDAYYSVPIHSSSRPFLRFIWNGKKYQFTCLPNGLSCAPRVFTKLLKPVYSTLRKMGHVNVAYIDDSLLVSDSYSECVQNINHTVSIFDHLGFTVHPDKSVLKPTQSITFVGFVLDSRSMTICLTEEKANRIVSDCEKLLHKCEVSIRDFAQIIGKFVASEPGVEHAALHLKSLELEKEKQLKKFSGNFDAKFQLSENVKHELHWWIDNVHTTFKPIFRPPPDIELESDSSNYGWGGVSKTDDLKTGGFWSYEEQHHHINVLELKAIFLTLKCFCSSRSNVHVRLYSDNTVAVNYINKQGGRKDMLNDLTRDIWFWCIKRNIWISSNHLPGSFNVTADKMSRKLNDDLEWKLNPNVFNCIQEIFGPLHFDLFASRLNAQLEHYISFLPDPGAVHVDAFSISWTNETNYAFPPFSLLGRVLQKVTEDKARVVLLAPLWTTQPWFGQLLSLVAATPYLLPPKNLLQLPTRPFQTHPLTKLRMGVFMLSGHASEVSKFQRTLSILSKHPGEIPQNNNIGVISNNGCYFVVKGKLLHLQHLYI